MRTTKKIHGNIIIADVGFVSNNAGDAKPKSGGQKQVRLTRTEVKKAEARLAMFGYRPGRVDGVIDGNTRHALSF